MNNVRNLPAKVEKVIGKGMCRFDPPVKLNATEEPSPFTNDVKHTPHTEYAVLAPKIGRLTLDQMLWRGEWKISPAALQQLATTEAWRTHAPADTTPEEIYGKNGSMGHLFNEPFTTRHDLQAALVENHGGGVSMKIIEALVACCGPRVEGVTQA